MTEPHTGTVTFFFSDIEGSTLLLQQAGEIYPTILADHRRLLRGVFQRYGGTEVDTAGDGFFIVFGSARDAVAASVAAQQAMAGHRWPDGARVRVRMGLHTGDSVAHAGEYVGLDVHRAARICAAAHGGQVLLSGTTRGIVANDLPPGVTLRHLGEHRLKDLHDPERLYQIVIPGLHSDFPRLRTLSAHPNNLPLQLTEIIGREDDINAVCYLLRRPSPRLITLTGPGGTGKTRLGLQVAASMIDDFPDGVFQVSLATIDDPTRVILSIGQVLGLAENLSRPVIDTVRDHLKERKVLLLLDNFEHLISAGTVVVDLLSMCPDLRVLVTSRSALRIRGEQEFPVLPLSIPDPRRLPGTNELLKYPAVDLFMQRALAARPDFTVTSESAAAVAEICYRLDGLPLALELAAARIKLFPPQAMLVRLNKGLELLRGGANDLPERHQTLHHAIAWSYDLLSPDEKALFRRISIFAGGFGLEAVTPVCNGGGDITLDTLDGLSALVDKSLLKQESATASDARFRMLETIREFGLGRLKESGEYDAVRHAHAEYYLAFAEEAERYLTGSQQGEWLDRLETDNDNLRLVLAWAQQAEQAETGLRLAGSIWRFWVVRGHMIEGEQHVTTLLALPGALAHTKSRAKALHGAATIIHETGRYQRALPLIEESLAIWREVGDTAGICSELINLCWVTILSGEVERARELCEECLAYSRKIGDQRAIALALNNFGWFFLMRGDVADALRYQRESLAMRRRIADTRGIAFALSVIGWVLDIAGEYDAAEEHLLQARAIVKELGDNQIGGFTTNLHGIVAHHRGDHSRSVHLLREGLSLIRGTGNQWGVALELAFLGRVLCVEGDRTAGRTMLQEVLALLDDEGVKWERALILAHLSRTALEDDEAEQGEMYCRESLSLRTAIEDRYGIAECLELMSEVRLKQRRADVAARLAGAAERTRKTIGAPLPLCYRKQYEDHLRAVQAEAGDAAFQAGAGMPLEAAVRMALESVASVDA